jgi:MATE family multidrug resistance protein
MSFSEHLLSSSSNDDKPYSTLSWSQRSTYLKEIMVNSLPTIAAFMTPVFTTLVSIYFMTKYNNDALVAGYGLGAMFSGAFGLAWIVSFNQSVNVHVSKAFGAQDYDGCAIYFRRNIVLLAIFMLPLLIALLFADKIMMFFGINEELASIAGQFTKLSTLFMGGSILFDTMKCFVIAQRVFHPILYIQIFTLSLHILWSKIFIDILEMGIVGAVICKILEEWANTALIYGYIMKSGKFTQTWGAWTKDIFNVQELWQQFKFGCSIGIISYGQWVFYELLTLIAGNFDEGQVVAHIAIGNISSFHYTFSLAVSVTMLTFLGNNLGERKLNRAKNYMWASFTLIGIQTVVYWLFAFFARYSWVEFWSNDPVTQGYLLETLLIYTFGCLLVDAINNGFLATLKTVGQEKATIANVLIVMYLVGAPLIMLFAFVFDMKVKGIWLGFGLCSFVLLAVNLRAFLKLDWKEIQNEVIRKSQQGKTEETELGLIH